MNYKNKKVAISGYGNGFIADKLAEALAQAGSEVLVLSGDLRDPKTFGGITYKYDYYFHFGAPSSQVLFKRKPRYCVDATINGFLNAVKVCEENGVRLIYPSTGLLSAGESNEYASCKAICEQLAPKDSLGLRIFASYGPTEAHKRDYASVPYLFIRDMVNGKRPEIFGDGSQKRDLIYIDDVVEAIMILAEECNEPVINIGSGKAYSFNEIVAITNGLLGTDIKPVYFPAPKNYVNETLANIKSLKGFYKPHTSLAQGVAKIIEELTKPPKPPEPIERDESAKL